MSKTHGTNTGTQGNQKADKNAPGHGSKDKQDSTGGGNPGGGKGGESTGGQSEGHSGQNRTK